MYTKNQLKEQLKNMGLAGNETILVHSSMKSIGAVDGGADTVLDALIEYFEDGLLLFQLIHGKMSMQTIQYLIIEQHHHAWDFSLICL